MNISSAWIWGIAGTVGLVLLIWVWARVKHGTAHESMSATIKRRIREWLNAVDKEEFVLGKRQGEARDKELAARLESVESGLAHQDRLDEWAADLRRHLRRLEELPSQEVSDHHTGQQRVVPRSVLRLGVRVTLTDLIWKGLGIVQPWDLPDHQIDKVLQGPFCRNCLRSLVASENHENEERFIRHQCRHCSLSWRTDSDSSTVSLLQFKREVYELLDTEYRRNGKIGIREEF